MPNSEPPTTLASARLDRCGASVSPGLHPTKRPEPPRSHRSDQTCPVSDGSADSADPPPRPQYHSCGDTGRDQHHTNRRPPPQPGSPDRTRPTNPTDPDSHTHQHRTTRPPNTPPLASTAAATCTSACVSTPPTTPDTINMAAPYHSHMGKGGGTRHRGGGTDPTEPQLSAQPEIHRPTGASNTSHIIPPSRIWAVSVRFASEPSLNTPHISIWHICGRWPFEVVGLSGGR